MIEDLSKFKETFSIYMKEKYNGKWDKSKQTSVTLIKRQKELIDLLVENKLEESRSEFIRKAIDYYLIHCLQLMESQETLFERFVNSKVKRRLK